MSKGQYYVGSGREGSFRHSARKLVVPKGDDDVGCEVSVLEVEGEQEGPTLGLVGGVHGDEHTGTEIVRRVITSLDPRELKGRIAAIPVANPLAFEAIVRDTPHDSVNLNRVFPGTKDGSVTHRLAAVLTDEYVKGLDYLIDVHAGGRQGWVDFAIGLGDRSAALALGVEYIRHGEKIQGALTQAAQASGVKDCALFEFGGLECSGPMVDKGVRAVLNLMRHWGMLPGDLELSPRQFLFTNLTAVRTDITGLLYKDPDNAVIGKEIPKDALVARIVNPYTFEVIHEIRASFDRNLVVQVPVRDGLVIPGDWLFQFADLDQTEIVDNK